MSSSVVHSCFAAAIGWQYYGRSTSRRVTVVVGRTHRHKLAHGRAKLFGHVLEHAITQDIRFQVADTVRTQRELDSLTNWECLVFGTWTWALDWAAGGAKSKVYTYYFDHTPAEDASGGAYHGSELWYVFNNIPYADYSNVTWGPRDYTVEAIMSDYWVNFIKTGDPNGEGLNYFPPSNEVKQTMYLGDNFGAGPLAASDERIDFVKLWFGSLPS